jgi:hypothetical protein
LRELVPVSSVDRFPLGRRSRRCSSQRRQPLGAAFGLDAATRVALALSHGSDEQEPLYYVARLMTFGLIITAILQKNRPNSSGR